MGIEDVIVKPELRVRVSQTNKKSGNTFHVTAVVDLNARNTIGCC